MEAIIGSIPKLWDEREANAGSLTFVQRLKGRVYVDTADRDRGMWQLIRAGAY